MPLRQVPKKPTSDSMRSKLGGRIGDQPQPEAGRVVLLIGREPHVGVVLCVDDATAFVWIEDNEVKQVSRSELRAYDAIVPEAVRRRSELAAAYAELRERTDIIARTPRGPEKMLLVEKCRFGVLAERDDGMIVALGFSNVTSAASATH